MRRSATTAAALFAAALATPAAAQQYAYSALLGYRDMVNSSGVPLGNFCAIVQQDRANVHRFGVWDEYDTGDAFFADQGTRALISQMCRVQPGYEYIRNSVLAGEPRFVSVFVTLRNGRVVDIMVTEGAG